jgi:hypothetical protein
MTQKYFYCCSLPLETGSIIRPGNWGRILRLYTPQSSPNSWVLTRELAWESVRLRAFPEKPSRFDGIFVCLNEKDIDEFIASSKRFIDLRYEVELIDSNAISHIGDWTLANMQNTDDVTVFERRAQLYWQGTNIVKQELLTTSPIRIVRVLS